MGDDRERREPRGVSDSKTGGTTSKRKAALGEDEMVAQRQWRTQIGSFSQRHNLKRSSVGQKEALWGA